MTIDWAICSLPESKALAPGSIRQAPRRCRRSLACASKALRSGLRSAYLLRSFLSAQLSPDEDFVGLQKRGQAGLFWKIHPDPVRIWAEGSLQCLQRAAENMAHGHVDRRHTRRVTGTTAIDGVILACARQALFDHRHVPVALAVVVKTPLGCSDP